MLIGWTCVGYMSIPCISFIIIKLLSFFQHKLCIYACILAHECDPVVTIKSSNKPVISIIYTLYALRHFCMKLIFIFVRKYFKFHRQLQYYWWSLCWTWSIIINSRYYKIIQIQSLLIMPLYNLYIWQAISARGMMRIRGGICN